MRKIQARCTQCGHTEYGSPEKNSNYVEYRANKHELKHGTGREHGTEVFDCPQCDEQTVHNRCGNSVPQSGKV